MEAEASLFGHSASMRIVPDCTGEGGPCQLLLMLLLPNSSSAQSTLCCNTRDLSNGSW